VDSSQPSVNSSPALSEAKRLLLEKRLKRVPGAASPRETQLARRPAGTPALASLGQKRIWLLDDVSGRSPAYNITSSFYVTSLVDPKALEVALNRVVSRHEPLRSRYELAGKEISQISIDELRHELTHEQGDATFAIEAAAGAFGRTPFDIRNGPPLRLGLFSQGDRRHLLILTVHHIVFDNWSLKLFWKEFSAFYAEAVAGISPSLPDIDYSYSDFSYWQRKWLDEGEGDRQLAYWKKQLERPPPPLPFATDHPYPRAIGEAGRLERHQLSARTTGRLRELATAEDASLFMVLLLGFKVLLGKYTNTADLLVSSPVANRRNRETADLIGFFLNTLVIRTDLTGDPTGREALTRIRQASLEALTHQDLPPDAIVEAIKPKRVPGRHPLFQTMFVFQREDEGTPKLSLHGCAVSPTYIETKTSKFDLSLFVAETPDGMETIAEYRTDVFEADTIQGFLRHYTQLMDELSKHPEKRLSELNLLHPDDLYTLLSEVQGERIPIRDTPLLPHRIAAYASTSPGAVALQSDSASITYADLERQATRLARRIVEKCGFSTAPVGIFMERSPDAIVAILAVLKSGAPYLPIDPSYPARRNRMLIEDAQPSCILCARTEAGALRSLTTVDLVFPDETGSEQTPLPRIDAAALAYLISTSGSTGRPKAVMVTHENLRQSTFSRCRYYARPPERLLLLPSLSFDSSVASIFWTLAEGRTLVLPATGEEKDPEAICRLTQSHGITTLLCVPSLYREILAANPAALASLSTVIVAGEACPPSLVDAHYGALPHCALYNEYGPTEATVWCSAALLTPDEAVTIGKAIPNYQVHVLSEEQRLLPVGIPGELYIAGEGVAKGYLRNETLTAERFPLVELPNGRRERMYRTGDRARRLHNGSMVFLGRLDDQVKIRGFRVELGEVETALGALPGVQEAVAQVIETAQGGETAARLVGYLRLSVPSSRDAKQLKQELAGHLPPHALPAQFVFLDSIPRLPNGKVDRRALPEPAPEERDPASLLEPRNATESGLLEIWKDVLGLQTLSVDDNFFDLGGTSILAIRLFSRIKSVFHCSIPVGNLIQYPSIQELATLLGPASKHDSFKYLVQLKQGSQEATQVFMVHSGGLQVLFYRDLARHIDGKFSLYGIQPVGHDGTEDPLDSIEAMSDRYLGEIRRIQPHGPYLLLGHCFGVAVAIEISKRLQDEGEAVPLLIAFDGEAPLPPGYVPPPPPSLWKLEVTPREAYRELRSSLRARLQARKDRLALKSGDSDRVSDVRIRRTGKAVADAFQRYRCAPYRQRILAFHCLDSERYPNHSRKDWMRAAPNMEMIEMNCLHENLLVEPNVQEVARIIERSIASCQKDAPAQAESRPATVAPAAIGEHRSDD
jgi:amino acid adenylation domain-containing protein